MQVQNRRCDSRMKRNIIQKIWDEHVVVHQDGHPAVLAIDLMLLHEVTSAQAFAELEKRSLPVFDPTRLIATLDHSISTRADRRGFHLPAAALQVETLRRNAAKHGIPLFDLDSGRQGIVHVIGPELGLTQPGMTIVCGDSHTATHGAFGALAFGIGTTEVAHVLAAGALLQYPPKTMRVEFTGRFRRGIFSKDAVLKLIAMIGVGGANGHVIEYAGDTVGAMSMEERMTVCNMSIECGARSGLIAPDETTFHYLKGRPYSPEGIEWERAVERWKAFSSDDGAGSDRTVTIDVGSLKPMITWGTNPAQAIPIDERIPPLEDLSASDRLSAEMALAYNGLKPGTPIEGTAIQWAFLGSCTNGRIEDLRVAARVLQGRRIADDVTMYVVPGSEAVQAQARREGLDRIFMDAGAQFRNPGCSMCLGMNDDKVPAGQRCVSSSNRNFVGRQGDGSFTHLASPATVAASAIAGRIVSAEGYF